MTTQDGTRHLFSNPDETHLLCGRAVEPESPRRTWDGSELGPADLCQQCWFIASFSDYEHARLTVHAAR